MSDEEELKHEIYVKAEPLYDGGMKLDGKREYAKALIAFKCVVELTKGRENRAIFTLNVMATHNVGCQLKNTGDLAGAEVVFVETSKYKFMYESMFHLAEIYASNRNPNLIRFYSRAALGGHKGALKITERLGCDEEQLNYYANMDELPLDLIPSSYENIDEFPMDLIPSSFIGGGEGSSGRT